MLKEYRNKNFTAEIQQLIKTLEEKRKILKNKEEEEEKFHSNIKDLILKLKNISENLKKFQNA